MSLARDIQRQDINARMQAQTLRQQAKVYQKQGKAKMYGTLAKSALKIDEGVEQAGMSAILGGK
jgi:propanediol dehydratase small subunit